MKYSLLLHSLIVGLLVLVTYFWRGPSSRKVKFIILPKGTALDAVVTPELAQDVLRASAERLRENDTFGESNVAASPTFEPPPTVTRRHESPRTASDSTPVLSTPAPTSTPQATATPEKTIVAKSHQSPTPSPQRPKTTVKPSSSPAKSPGRPSGSPRASQLINAASTRKATAVTRDHSSVPRQLPRGVTPRAAALHEEIGVPGVGDGQEGAPLALDRTQSLLSALYATRARMKIQSNFQVPPDVNDPSLTCIVEWEITTDGSIRNIRVLKSSGVARLDACAVEALRKTANLGPLPPEWGQRSVWTSLTFQFSGDFPAQVPLDTAPSSANPQSTLSSP